MPEVSLPFASTLGTSTVYCFNRFATYLGWNLRGTGHAVGEACISTGSAIPFAVGPATRAATDPRTTLASLYAGRSDYLTKFGAATDALVARGYLTTLDATYVYKAGAAQISPALIPNP